MERKPLKYVVRKRWNSLEEKAQAAKEADEMRMRVKTLILARQNVRAQSEGGIFEGTTLNPTSLKNSGISSSSSSGSSLNCPRADVDGDDGNDIETHAMKLMRLFCDEDKSKETNRLYPSGSSSKAKNVSKETILTKGNSKALKKLKARSLFSSDSMLITPEDEEALQEELKRANAKELNNNEPNSTFCKKNLKTRKEFLQILERYSGKTKDKWFRKKWNEYWENVPIGQRPTDSELWSTFSLSVKQRRACEKELKYRKLDDPEYLKAFQTKFYEAQRKRELAKVDREVRDKVESDLEESMVEIAKSGLDSRSGVLPKHGGKQDSEETCPDTNLSVKSTIKCQSLTEAKVSRLLNTSTSSESNDEGRSSMALKLSLDNLVSSSTASSPPCGGPFPVLAAHLKIIGVRESFDDMSLSRRSRAATDICHAGGMSPLHAHGQPTSPFHPLLHADYPPSPFGGFSQADYFSQTEYSPVGSPEFCAPPKDRFFPPSTPTSTGSVCSQPPPAQTVPPAQRVMGNFPSLSPGTPQHGFWDPNSPRNICKGGKGYPIVKRDGLIPVLVGSRTAVPTVGTVSAAAARPMTTIPGAVTGKKGSVTIHNFQTAGGFIQGVKGGGKYLPPLPLNLPHVKGKGGKSPHASVKLNLSPPTGNSPRYDPYNPMNSPCHSPHHSVGHSPTPVSHKGTPGTVCRKGDRIDRLRRASSFGFKGFLHDAKGGEISPFGQYPGVYPAGGKPNFPAAGKPSSKGKSDVPPGQGGKGAWGKNFLLLK